MRDNPDDGANWFNYGFALHSLKRYEEAIKAAKKAAELGFRQETAYYNIACAHALMGHKDEALTWLEKALSSGFIQDGLVRTDTDLDSIRDDPRFKKMIGSPPDGLSRDERWQYDLDYLVRRMEKMHYNLYAKVSREKLQQSIADLKTKVGDLKDEEIGVGIQGILALVGDGHTSMDWESRHTQGKAPRPRYPVEYYLYKEGIYVRGAAPELAEIVGGQVLRIGSTSAEKALDAVAPLCSRDNSMGIKLQAPIYLTHPAVLSYLKLTDDMSHAALVVKKTNGDEANVELKPAPIDREEVKKFVRANAKSKSPEPISFKKNDDKFWYEYLPEKKMVYCQYNQVANKNGESLESFWGKMFDFINKKSVNILVIDMRNNGGGNNFLNRPLIHGLIRCDRVNQPGHLYVLVGRTTFSAAMNCAVDIERNTNAMFVGEPTGSSPNFVGETNILVLPWSSLRLSCSSLYWQSSTATDRRTWIAPALKAEPSFVAFAANRDPGLEAVFAYVETNTIAADNEVKKGLDFTFREIIDECNRQAIKDFKKGDMLAVAQGYADDATIYFPQGKKVHGRKEIDRYWKNVKGAKDWKLETLEVGGIKEAIYEVGKSTLTTEVDGKESTYVCDYVVIWKRQKDGTYRAHTDIFN